MKKRTILSSFAAIMLAGQLVAVAELPIPPEEATLDGCLKLIQSSNDFERNRVVVIFDNQRKKAIRSLIATLDGQFPLEVKLDAARALGQYRAPEAVAVLVKNLQLEIAFEKQSHQILSGLDTDEQHAFRLKPISTGIEKLGSPAIPALLGCLVANDDAKVRELSLKILYHIDGDKDIVQLRLQKALAAEKDSQKQARLQSALKSLADTSFGN